jgi:UDP-N-acetylmuramoylalanine--D-glutamate ligase
MQSLRNQRVTVVGLGRFGGGIAVARWLVEQGARVLMTDREPAERLQQSLRQLDGLPIEYRLGEHRESDFDAADVVVASPAVPLNSPFLEIARRAGVPITTEIRLFIERCPAPILGVTGTKGKSTTTAMLGQMLRRRHATCVGGNIGHSLLHDLPNITPNDQVVLELSSYMLEHLRPLAWSPHVAVITMIVSDHLEWHGSRDNYVAAKRVILQFQSPDDVAVINEADATSLALAEAAASRVIRFGVRDRRPFELSLVGAHNQLNAQAAFAAASVLGITWDEAQAALRDFRGLPHRLQLVHEQAGVRYYNDSIATIPEAAVAALDAFERGRVIQIVGGYDKHLPFDQMSAALADRAKAVLCIGRTGPTIADQIERVPARCAAVHRCGDLATAMARASAIATGGDVVLLSTGCASYDQFDNFEQRGEQFAQLARQIGSVTGTTPA